MGRPSPNTSPHAASAKPYEAPAEEEDAPPVPPPWMQRAPAGAPPHPEQTYPERQPIERTGHPEQDYPSAVHPLRRYAAQHAEPEQRL